MDKHKILAAAKAEIERHTCGTFVDGDSGKGVVVPGCEACRKQLQSNDVKDVTITKFTEICTV